MLAIRNRKGGVARVTLEAIVLENLNVSTPRMIAAGLRAEIHDSFYDGGQQERPGGKKSENQSQP
jgi:hypothetical protein